MHSIEEVRASIKEHRTVAIDFEATSLTGNPRDAVNPWLATPTLISIATKDKVGVYSINEESIAFFREVTGNSANAVMAHNPAYDFILAHVSGIQLFPDVKAKLLDTLTMCWSFNEEERSHGLKFLVEKYCKYKMVTYDEVTKSSDTMLLLDRLQRSIVMHDQNLQVWTDVPAKSKRPYPSLNGPAIGWAKIRRMIINESGLDGKTDKKLLLSMRDSLFSAEQREKYKQYVEGAREKALILVHGLKNKAEQEFRKYAADDTKQLFKLARYAKKRIDKEGTWRWLYDIEHEVLSVCIQAEIDGMPMDVKGLREKRETLLPIVDDLKDRVYRLASNWDFNINSTTDLPRILFADLGIRPPVFEVLDNPFIRNEKWHAPNFNKWGLDYVKEHGIAFDCRSYKTWPKELLERGLSTAKVTLELLEHPIGQAILDYRVAEKLRSTYLDGLLPKLEASEDKCIHAKFNPIGAKATGRFSSSGPNLQNIPSRSKGAEYDERIQYFGAELRSLFIAPPADKNAPEGYALIISDLSQIELRLIAHTTQDTRMLNVYNESVEVNGQIHYTGDIHLSTQTSMGIPRKAAKNCLDGSTLVTTREGTTPIDSILANVSTDDHSPIPEVFLADGKGGWVSSSRGIKREAQPCVSVVSSRGVLTCTYDHKVQTSRGLVAAKDLVAGDTLVPISLPALTGSPVTIKVNPFTASTGTGPGSMILDGDWGYFTGLFLGDGCMMSTNRASIAHDHHEDLAWWREEVRAASEIVGLPAHTSSNNKYTRIGSTVVSRNLQKLGMTPKKGKDIRVPPWVCQGGPEVIAAFLAGLIDADGTVGKSLSLTTRCPVFAGQIAVLLRLLGIDVSMDPGWNITYKKYYYRIRVRKGSLQTVIQSILPRMRHRDKVLKLMAFDGAGHSSHNLDNNVKLVVSAGTRDVYDFDVDSEEHLYIQGGVLGHNCNFGMVYGIGAKKYARMNRMLKDGTFEYNVELADEYKRGFFQSYPGIPAYTKTLRDRWNQGERNFRLMSGRLRHFNPRPGENVPASKILNSEIQGSAADLLKIAIAAIHKYVTPRYKGFRFAFQVHDELGFICPKRYVEEASWLVKYLMEFMFIPLRVPLLAGAKVCGNWADAANDDIPEVGVMYARVNDEDRLFDETNWTEFVKADKEGSISLKGSTAMLSPAQLDFCRTTLGELAPKSASPDYKTREEMIALRNGG
jgi:DNA polymerase I-like protein with 3'-5' exonuclease and polymerase domains